MSSQRPVTLSHIRFLFVKAPLNFGPAEQTRAQRQEIATRALAITLAEEKQVAADLQALYDRYVEGEIDLYGVALDELC